MARGWESKSVEDQQALATASKSGPRKTFTPEEIRLQRHREALLLSRSRITQQLQAAQNPEYKKMLESALADLDLQLARPD